jgi:uncharacterized heparinase superfamily protein
MRAADHDLAFANARALVDDWITVEGRRLGGLPHEPDVVAARLIAWFSHSPIVLRGADHGFYRRFLKSIALADALSPKHVSAMPADATRFKAGSRLRWQACACRQAVRAGSRGGPQSRSAKFNAQILPDGGHVSRNPMVLIELLTHLLPLKQTYVNLGQKPPHNMAAGMDRMFSACVSSAIPMASWCCSMALLRFPRTGLLGVLRYDETSGSAFREMPHSHYQRLSAGNVVLIADTGATTAGDLVEASRMRVACRSSCLRGPTDSSSMPALRWCRYRSMRILPG